jgi:hypothetical protein
LSSAILIDRRPLNHVNNQNRKTFCVTLIT